MSRKRYPSDHRRWFRVNEDILDDEKLAAVSADVFRFYFRLLAMLNRTKSRDGKIALDRWALNAAAMRDRHGAALALARCGAGAGLFRLRYEGSTAFIEVYKWPVIQELAPAELRRDSSRTPSPKTTPKTTPTPIKKESAPPALELVEPEVISAEWGEVVDAMSAYVPSRAGCRSSAKRSASMAKVAKQFGPTAPVDAIHGYAAMHFGKPASNGFDPEVNFTVETIWSGKVAKYLDADREARDSGRVRPYLACQKDSVRDMTLRIAAQIKSERGWLDG